MILLLCGISKKQQQKTKLIDTENKLVVPEVGVGDGQMGEGGQKIQTSGYK